MKDIGCSDLWDIFIERYCDKKERVLLIHLPIEEYNKLEELFSIFYEDFKKSLEELKSK